VQQAGFLLTEDHAPLMGAPPQYFH